MRRRSVDIVIYAMGGGCGHIMRACGLARKLCEADQSLEIRIYHPDRCLEWVKRMGVQSHSPRIGAERNPAWLRPWIASRLEEDKPALIVTDCFPLGFREELAGLVCKIPKRVFLTRWLQPEFVAKGEARRFLESCDKLLTMERLHPDLLDLNFQVIDPVLSLPSEEILDRDSARSEIGLSNSTRHVFLVATSLNRTKVAYALQAAGERYGFQLHQVHPTTPFGRRFFPIARYLRAPDLVVGAPGANLYYEVAQAGVPALFIPFNLENDNHKERVLGHLGPSHSQSRGADSRSVSTFFPEILTRPLQPVIPLRGAHQAAAEILRVLFAAA